MLTAGVAILLALHQWIPMGTMFIVGIMLAVAGVSLYLKLEENKRQEAADRRRRKMYAARRAEQARQNGQPVPAVELEAEPLRPTSPVTPRSPAEMLRDFRFQFSMSQLFVAITVAALLLGLSSAVGGLAGLATICGLLALGGLIVPLLGYQPSDVVIFGWWIALALYVVLSISAKIWASLNGS